MNLLKKLSVKQLVAGGLSIVAVATIVTVILVLQLQGYRLIQIYNVTGNAYVNRENQEFKAYENLIMQSEDSVMTHSESFVRMKLDEDKYVLIEEDTVVGIVASGNKKAGRTDLDLREGSVTVEIDEHLTGNSSFTVTTPNSVMAVRGTVFRVALEYDENGVLRTHITVWEGNVEVLTSDGNVIIEGNPNLDKGKEAYVYLDGKVLHMNPCPKIEYEKMPKEIIPFLEEAIERERDIQLPSQEELAAIFAPDSPDDGPGGPGGSGGPSGLAEPAPAPAEQTSQPEESVGDTQAPTAADVAPAAPVNPVLAQELLPQPVPAEITPTPAPTQSSSSGSSSSSRGGSSGGSSSNAGNQANTNQDPQQDPNQNQQDPQQDPTQATHEQQVQMLQDDIALALNMGDLEPDQNFSDALNTYLQNILEGDEVPMATFQQLFNAYATAQNSDLTESATYASDLSTGIDNAINHVKNNSNANTVTGVLYETINSDGHLNNFGYQGDYGGRFSRNDITQLDNDIAFLETVIANPTDGMTQDDIASIDTLKEELETTKEKATLYCTVREALGIEGNMQITPDNAASATSAQKEAARTAITNSGLSSDDSDVAYLLSMIGN